MALGNRSPGGDHQGSDSASESDSGSILPHERRHAAARRDERDLTGMTASGGSRARARMFCDSIGQLNASQAQSRLHGGWGVHA